MTQIFYQIIFALLTTSTINTDEVEITLDFCDFGQDFYKEMVFSLIGEFKFIYIEKLKELYVNMKNRMKEITELIYDLRGINFKEGNRTTSPSGLKLTGLISDVHKKINKSFSYLDEMGLIVTDGKSADCANQISDGKYDKAAEILTAIENNGLIYSIVTMVYNGYGPDLQNLACENLFGFTAHLNSHGLYLKSAAVYISLFSVLIENKKYYSGCMLQLAELAKQDYDQLSSRQVYAHQYAILSKRYRYIKDGSASIVRQIVYGNLNKNQWCIINPVHDSYLVTERNDVFTKWLSKGYDNSKWTIEYDFVALAYKIRNEQRYLQLSTALQSNQYMREIQVGTDERSQNILWTINPIDDDQFMIESLKTKDKLISGPDTDYYKQSLQRHVFAHNHEFAQLPTDGIDRWELREC